MGGGLKTVKIVGLQDTERDGCHLIITLSSTYTAPVVKVFHIVIVTTTT